MTTKEVEAVISQLRTRAAGNARINPARATGFDDAADMLWQALQESKAKRAPLPRRALDTRPSRQIS